MSSQTVSRSSHSPILTALSAVLFMAALLATGCAKKPLPEENAASGAPSETKMVDAESSEIPEASRPQLDKYGRVRATGISRNPGEGEALVADLYFGFNSSDLTATSRQSLDQAAKLLKDKPGWTVIVEGHCDERGTDEYNLGLGLRRANAAASYLRGKGIDSQRIDTVSFGEAFPADRGHDEAAWTKNRRAHLGFEAPPAISSAE